MFNRGLFKSSPGIHSTPMSLFNELNEEFHFTLDPCATAETAKCYRYYAPEKDGLSMPWFGRVFVNPPYGPAIRKWIQKAWDEILVGRAEVVVMLLPSRTDTRWWHSWVLSFASEIRFVRGRVRFGGAKAGAPFPSCIVVFRRPKKRRFPWFVRS